jgi:hypothetical protein
MKKTKAHGGLHLVGPEEAARIAKQAKPRVAEPEPASAQQLDSLIANGIRRYQQLQQEFDRELFGERNLENIEIILPELHLLRERLASYGVHVKL